MLVLIVLTLYELHILDKPSYHLKILSMDAQPRNVQPAGAIVDMDIYTDSNTLIQYQSI